MLKLCSFLRIFDFNSRKTTMFAVIKTGGKQYVVKEGDELHVEKLATGAGGSVLFEEVLLIDDGENTLVGAPVVREGGREGGCLETLRDDKVIVLKRKRRKQYRRTPGASSIPGQDSDCPDLPRSDGCSGRRAGLSSRPRSLSPESVEPKAKPKTKAKAEKPAPKTAEENRPP